MFGEKLLNKKEVLFFGKLYDVFEYESCIKWKFNGEIHRECDKPAVIYKNGTKEWRIQGLLHRENDKPAIIRASGGKEWYLNGVRHRGFGKPAIMSNDILDYFEFGEKLAKEKVLIKYKIGNF